MLCKEDMYVCPLSRDIYIYIYIIDKPWNYFSISYVNMGVISGKDTDRYVEC